MPIFDEKEMVCCGGGFAAKLQSRAGHERAEFAAARRAWDRRGLQRGYAPEDLLAQAIARIWAGEPVQPRTYGHDQSYAGRRWSASEEAEYRRRLLALAKPAAPFSCTRGEVCEKALERALAANRPRYEFEIPAALGPLRVETVNTRLSWSRSSEGAGGVCWIGRGAGRDCSGRVVRFAGAEPVFRGSGWRREICQLGRLLADDGSGWREVATPWL